MHTQSDDIITLEDSYSPDFVNRKKYEKESGMTLKEWTEQNEFNGKYITYRELCGTELKTFTMR